METPTELAHGLRSLSTPEELIGALQSNFGTVMPQPEADAYTESIVTTAKFDNVDSLADLRMSDLADMGIPLGRRRAICKNLFSGIVPLEHPSTGAVVQPSPSPVVNVQPANVTVQRDVAKVGWPGSSENSKCSPDQLMDFAMALRARLRETNDSFAAIAYDALLKPWSVTSGHTDGDGLDKSLSTVLLKTPYPAWIAPLVRSTLDKDFAIAALKSIGKVVMARTDISDRKLKDAVRDPQPEADAHQVATRMLC